MLKLLFFFFSYALFAVPIQHGAPHPKPNAAYDWLNVSLEATAREVDRLGARPTIISRHLSVAMTAMFDAWALYDDHAVGTQLGSQHRRPLTERTIENKSRAIGWGTAHALINLFPDDAEWIRSQLVIRGFKLTRPEKDSPEEFAQLVVDKLISYRKNDGSNQSGEMKGSNGKPYSDYTGYKAINSTVIINPDKWQPIPFLDAKGLVFTPDFLTPHWYKVKPFLLKKNNLFRPRDYPKVGSRQLKKEVDEVLAYNQSLTPKEKAIIEFMRDGPRSTGQSGHWLRIAQDVSRRDEYNLDQDVMLYFAVANVAFDAFIAAWESKRFYDSSRPWTLIRHYYKGQKIKGWLGPDKGIGEIDASEWKPYSPDNFVTPPFPGFVSGHSTVSAACARVLELYTGSDHFGGIERRKPGFLTESVCADDGCMVELELPTFSATAEMAGISRIMGGYHIQADNVEGLKMGKSVANHIWPGIKNYFNRKK